MLKAYASRRVNVSVLFRRGWCEVAEPDKAAHVRLWDEDVRQRPTEIRRSLFSVLAARFVFMGSGFDVPGAMFGVRSSGLRNPGT
jgi:hypothetical protein